MADWDYYTKFDIGRPDRYFRVDDVGHYQNWDPARRTWVPNHDPKVRDYYSRAIENGDGVVPTPSADVARLR